MTDQEIDKWVEEHLNGIDEDPRLNDIYIKIGKVIAHKFYEFGCKAGAEAFKQSLNMY